MSDSSISVQHVHMTTTDPDEADALLTAACTEHRAETAEGRLIVVEPASGSLRR